MNAMDKGETGDMFENLMGRVGYHGKFQKRFNILFNVVLIMFLAMQPVNLVLALTVPDHWCHVPGRNNTNFTMEEWKTLTIPREMDTYGQLSHSKCRMYNMTDPLNLTSLQHIDGEKQFSTVECQFGWDYDRTWFKRNLITQETWVCDKKLYVTYTLTANGIGDFLGILIMGQIGDAFGRRFSFILSSVLVLGTSLSTACANIYPLFYAFILIGSMSQTQSLENPLVLAMEMTSPEKRLQVAMFQTMSWSLGCCIVPFIAWVSGDWIIFILVTALPCTLILAFSRWFPESARWLAAKGKPARCLATLQEIAKVNKTSLPQDSLMTLQKIADNKERTYGIVSLFSSWRLAKNTFLLAFNQLTVVLATFILLLDVGSLSGNPFLNYFLLFLGDFPAILLGRFLSTRYGRRWAVCWSYIATFLLCLVLIFIVRDPEMGVLVTCFVLLTKFAVITPLFSMFLWNMETFPTCVRESGMSLCMLVASTANTLVPYIIYLGTTTDARYPYVVLLLVCATAMVCALFLPETMYERIPETLADAAVFGKDQQFWALPKKPEYLPC